MSPEEQAKHYRELVEHLTHAGNTLIERIANLEAALREARSALMFYGRATVDCADDGKRAKQTLADIDSLVDAALGEGGE